MPRPWPPYSVNLRQAEALIANLPPRQELAHRLALQGFCDECGSDPAWRARLERLMFEHRDELAAIFREAWEIARRLIHGAP